MGTPSAVRDHPEWPLSKCSQVPDLWEGQGLLGARDDEDIIRGRGSTCKAAVEAKVGSTCKAAVLQALLLMQAHECYD